MFDPLTSSRQGVGEAPQKPIMEENIPIAHARPQAPDSGGGQAVGLPHAVRTLLSTPQDLASRSAYTRKSSGPTSPG